MRKATVIGLMVLGGCTESVSFDEFDEIAAAKRAEEADRAADAGPGSGSSLPLSVEPAMSGGPCVAETVGQGCLVGTGQCTRDGTWTCVDGEAVCDAVAAEPRDELCDTAKDEDCDGVVDEAPEGQCCDDAECADGELCARLPPDVDAFKAGQCVVPEACGGAELQMDPDNCGVCAFECKPDEVCNAGKCELQCDAELEMDPANCGVCGLKCGDGQQCVDGECQVIAVMGVSCPEAEQACGPVCIPETACCDSAACREDDATLPYCIEGACTACRSSSDCSSDELCDDGTCVPKPVPCDGTCSSREMCVDDECVCPGSTGLDSDENNCGKCGMRCSSLTQECINGECAGVCGGKDIWTNPGACGTDCKKCGDGEVCSLGVCVPECGGSCGRGEQCIDGRCGCPGLDGSYQTDKNNCEYCGRVCRVGLVCGGAKCHNPPQPCGGECPDAEICIDDECVCVGLRGSYDTDENNCGHCGGTCAGVEECTGGRCVSHCGNGEVESGLGETCDHGATGEYNCDSSCQERHSLAGAYATQTAFMRCDPAAGLPCTFPWTSPEGTLREYCEGVRGQGYWCQPHVEGSKADCRRFIAGPWASRIPSDASVCLIPCTTEDDCPAPTQCTTLMGQRVCLE